MSGSHTQPVIADSKVLLFSGFFFAKTLARLAWFHVVLERHVESLLTLVVATPGLAQHTDQITVSSCSHHKSMELHVKSLQGSYVVSGLEGGTTISELKRMLHQQHEQQVPEPEEQCLVRWRACLSVCARTVLQSTSSCCSQ